MRIALLTTLAACQPPLDDPAPADSASPHDSAAVDDTASVWEEPEGDADRDGFTTDEGDCDDGDASVHPDVATDSCDEVDADCDGVVDEDFDGDPYEPNDTDGYDAGNLGDEGEALLHGYLFGPEDEDRFRFEVDDPTLGWFSVETWLYSVPDQADYSLELIWLETSDGSYGGTVGSADEHGVGGEEVIDHPGSVGTDDGGTYEVVVRSTSGSSCRHPYTLQVLVGGW